MRVYLQVIAEDSAEMKFNKTQASSDRFVILPRGISEASISPSLTVKSRMLRSIFVFLLHEELAELRKTDD